MDKQVLYCVVAVCCLAWAFEVKGQDKWQPKIVSDGKLTLGKTFTGTCQLLDNYEAEGFEINLPTLSWTCNMSKTLYTFEHNEKVKDYGDDGYLLNAVLTIATVMCDMEGVMCYCHRHELSDIKTVLSTNSMQLKFTRNPNLTLTYSTPVIERQTTTFTCTGYVQDTVPRLDIHMERDNRRDNVNISVTPQTIEADTLTCSRVVRATTRVRLLRGHAGYNVVCETNDTGFVTAKLNLSRVLEYSVEEVSIKFQKIILKRDSTYRVREGDTYTLRCLSDSNPPPTYEFYFIDEDSRLKYKLAIPNPDYMRRRAKHSHVGQYYCKARNTLSNGNFKIKTSRTLTLEVTDKVWALVAPIVVPIVIYLGIIGLVIYIRRRRAQAAGLRGSEDSTYGDSAYENTRPRSILVHRESEKQPSVPVIPEKRPSVVPSRRYDEDSYDSLSRSDRRSRHEWSGRSYSGDIGRRRSSRSSRRRSGGRSGGRYGGRSSRYSDWRSSRR